MDCDLLGVEIMRGLRDITALVPMAGLAVALCLDSSPGAAQSEWNDFDAGAQAAYSPVDADDFGDGGFRSYVITSGQDRGASGGNHYGVIKLQFGLDGAGDAETIGATTFSLEARESYGVSLRGGVTLAENLLLYGRLGFQGTDVELAVSGIDIDDEKDFNGLRVGGGIEALIGKNFSLRAEYLYTSNNDPRVEPGVEPYESEHRVRFGGSFRF